MSMFSNIQSPGNGPQDRKTVSGQQEQQTSVKDFVSGLNLFSDKQLTATQKAQVDKEASIFFNKFDTDGVQGLGGAEQTAAKSAVPEFIQQISVSDIFATNKKAPTEAEVKAARAAFIQQIQNANTPEEFQAIFQQEITNLQMAGYSNISADEFGNVTFTTPDGKQDSINLFKAMGVPDDVISQTNQKVAKNNMIAIRDHYAKPENGGYDTMENYSTRDITSNGETRLVAVVTLSNAKGEQIHITIDGETGREIKE